MRALRTAAAAAFVLGPPVAAHTADAQTFHGLTPAVYACTKEVGAAEHGTVYEPREGDAGTATSSGPLWRIVIAYTYHPDTGDLDHTILAKSWIIPVGAVWQGIADQIAECKARIP